MSTETASPTQSRFLGLSPTDLPSDSSDPDRRRSFRESYNVSAWLSPDAESRNGRQRQVLVSNLSLHGVGFISTTTLEVDAIHWIVVGAGALRASSRLRVASCRPRTDGGFEVGGEFF